MSVANSARRASGTLFRSSRSLSCPDISRNTPNASNNSSQIRHLNVMLLNPRAPKISHHNASHTLLIEMEKHVKKVQELEYKVHEMEMQLQLKELVKAHTAITQAWQAEKVVAERKEKALITEEEKQAFAIRLAEARRKAEQLSIKRNREEAEIMRSWQLKRLGSAIDKVSKIPESETMLLPEQSQVSEKDLASHAQLLDGIESLVNFAHPADEVGKLKTLLEERDNLRKLIEDIEMKEKHTNATVDECQNIVYNVNASRVQIHANLKMSDSVLNKMQTLEDKRRTSNLFVFGPNPIFSSVKDVELNYSISNQFVIKMLEELDIAHIIAQKNLKTAHDCRVKIQENRTQIEESLQLLQETINMQVETVNETNTDVKIAKEIKTEEAVPMIEQRPQEVGKNL